jgi:hypothetical protein
MNKIKVGVSVQYHNSSEVFTVVEKIKGAKTSKPVFHSGVLFNGYASKPCKYKLSNGDIVFPNQLKQINTP